MVQQEPPACATEPSVSEFRETRKCVSVVVPVYNSEGTLAELVRRVEEVFAGGAVQHEVVLVNDGSRDRGWEVIRELAGRHEGVRGINLMRNYGQHNALLAGIRSASGAVIVTIDDDLQHPPEEIPKLLAKLEEGCDVVYGVPEREQHGLARDLASRFIKLGLSATMGVEAARHVSAFRAFRAEVCRAFSNYQSPFALIDVLLSWGTTRFASVTVRHDPRQRGASNYSLRMLVVHTINMTTGYSTVPLQLASIIGFVCTLFGLGVFVYVIVRYLTEGGSVPGFPFLASLLAIFSGAQLFGLGIIGEYLARIHFRMMGRPSSVVRERVGFPAD